MVPRRTGPLVLYVLDSAGLSVIEGLMAEGLLPNIAALWRKSQLNRIGGPGYWDEIGTWLTAYSGVPATRHGYYSARRLKPGSYGIEIIKLEDALCQPCWSSITDPDFSALILDPIEGVFSPGLRGGQLYNLTVHQEAYAQAPLVVHPPDLAEVVGKVFGPVPSLRFDRLNETRAYYLRELRKNLDLLTRKTRLFQELVRTRDFRLLVVGFNELHDAAHLMWRFQNEDGADELRDAFRTLYCEVDRAIGAIQECLPADSTTWILSMYEMKPQYPVGDLAPGLLELLGLQVPAVGGASGSGFTPLGVARRLIPESVRFEVSKLLPAPVQQKLLASNFANSIDFAKSKAFALPTGLFSSHIRINLEGREPNGLVPRGGPYYDLLAEIEHELRSLIDPVTGGPAVSAVLRTADSDIDGPSLYLPDLFVHWKSASHFLERVTHPRGEIRQRKPGFFRDSYHGMPGFGALSGPGIAPGPLTDCSVLDIAPTLMNLLGQAPLPSMPGRSLVVTSATNP